MYNKVQKLLIGKQNYKRCDSTETWEHQEILDSKFTQGS
jgi:hypothetical protein